MKKRLISILLCGALVLSMAACGSKEGTKKEEAKTEETTKGNSGEATDKKYGLDMDSIVVAISSGYEPFCFTRIMNFRDMMLICGKNLKKEQASK